ncbi:MAG TPA: HDIG domain-containing protein [bacterium]|nr:HDIG domain-containing protein [bacterium]
MSRENKIQPLRLSGPDVFKRLVIGVGIITVLAVITFPSKTLYSFDLQVGDVASEDVISPIKYPVLKTPEELEGELAIKRASVRSAYVYSEDELQGSWREFANLIDDLKQAFEEPGGAEAQGYKDLAMSLEGRYRLSISTELLRRLDRNDELFDELANLPLSLQDTFKGGVIADRKRLSEADIANGILLRYPGDELYYGLNYSQIADLETVRGETTDLLEPQLNSPELTEELVTLAVGFCRPTIYLDEEATRERLEAAEASVDRVAFWVSENERIATDHEVVTPEVYRKLEALEAFRTSQGIVYVTLGRAAIIAVFLFIFGFFLYKYRRETFSDTRSWILIGLVLILTVGLSQALVTAFFQRVPQIGYLLPAALAGVLLATLLDVSIAVVGVLVTSVLLGLLTGFEVRYLFVFLTGGLAAVLSASTLRHRSSLYWISLKVAGAKLLIIAAIGLSVSDTWSATLSNAVLGTVGAIIGVFLASLVLPLFENLFHVTTPVKLLELSDLNQPILARLKQEAPGTFYHSLNVGILAEAAAGAVGANALLARVGAYYHDIGKLTKPEYFSENNPEQASKHENLSPSMSTLVIKSHVKEGIELAKRHRLPRGIVDFVEQHHGTGLISFFYQQALRLDEHKSLDKDDFRYPGPLAQSKETAIVMLADAVESASRTLSNTSVSAIRLLVRNVVNSRFMDGQLAECDLTLADLSTISDSFASTLTGILHSRVEYPEDIPTKDADDEEEDKDSEEEEV